MDLNYKTLQVHVTPMNYYSNINIIYITYRMMMVRWFDKLHGKRKQGCNP